jgi:dolichyl-diphosphooligosaccharide--protein glycosyltransferase
VCAPALCPLRWLCCWAAGYHINGIANRTSLADGNTWNHEHIALVGRALLLPPTEAHAIARHLADYVLLWTSRYGNGHGGDDLAKAAHIARIAASVYSDIDAEQVQMPRGRMAVPSEGLRRSLLFALHAHGLRDDAPTQSARELAELGFEEVFTSTHSMARVFRVLRVSEESRAHVAESYQRMHACHLRERELHPRCREGHGYPPAIASVLAGAKPFGRPAS